MKRSELEDFRLEKDVTVSRDGDRYCALIGADIQSGRTGYGKTEIEAVEDLRPKLTIREYSEARVFKVSVND